jgi:hypothetical protein
MKFEQGHQRFDFSYNMRTIPQSLNADISVVMGTLGLPHPKKLATRTG